MHMNIHELYNFIRQMLVFLTSHILIVYQQQHAVLIWLLLSYPV